MAVPRGTGAWREADRVGAHAGVVLVAHHDVEPHVTWNSSAGPLTVACLVWISTSGCFRPGSRTPGPTRGNPSVEGGLEETRRAARGTSPASSSPPASLGSGPRIPQSFRLLQVKGRPPAGVPDT